MTINSKLSFDNNIRPAGRNSQLSSSSSAKEETPPQPQDTVSQGEEQAPPTMWGKFKHFMKHDLSIEHICIPGMLILGMAAGEPGPLASLAIMGAAGVGVLMVATAVAAGRNAYHNHQENKGAKGQA